MPERKIRQVEKLIQELQAEIDEQRMPHDPNRSRWSRYWSAFVTASKKSVILTVRSAVGASLIVLIGLYAVKHQTDVQADNRVADNAAIAVDNTYDQGLALYVTSVLQRTLCVDGIAASGRNRGEWEVAVDQLRQAGLEGAALALESGPLLTHAARTASECPPLTVLPLNPRTGKVPMLNPDTLLPLVPAELIPVTSSS